METYREEKNKTVKTVLEDLEPPNKNIAIKNRILFKESPLKGGSFFVKNLQIEIVSHIKKCFALWQEFSSQKTLFDLWEFRYAFYKAYRYKPYFILLKNQSENLALLPLWYDRTQKRYTWFGSDWQEEIGFYTKEPKLLSVLLSAAPSPLYLNAIAKGRLKPCHKNLPFQKDDPKYILNLEKFNSHEDFLMTLKKNRRHDLRKDRRRIEKQHPVITINNFLEFDYLVDLCKKRFSRKGEEADFEDQRQIEAFRQVIKLSGKSYQARMLTVKIKNKPAGADLICLWNDCYYALRCGYDVKNFSGIGNFVNTFEIDDAIKLGMKKIDFLQNNYEWKDRWFKSIPLLKFEK